jgi:hypothetical protein
MSRRMRWVGPVALVGERRGMCRVLVGKFEGLRPLGRVRCRWRIILKWHFRKWEGGFDWIDLAQDRDRWRAVVNAVMNLQFPVQWGIS